MDLELAERIIELTDTMPRKMIAKELEVPKGTVLSYQSRLELIL